MKCESCKEGEMEKTEGTSFGTGGPIYKCDVCGWTYVVTTPKTDESTSTIKPKESVKPGMVYYVLRWLGGFCEIADGICVVLTAGYYNPGLSMRIVCYNTIKMLKRRMEK